MKHNGSYRTLKSTGYIESYRPFQQAYETIQAERKRDMKETISGTQSFEIIRTMLAYPFLAGMMKGTGCPVHVDLSKAEYSTSFAYSEIAAYLIRLGEAVIEFNKAE